MLSIVVQYSLASDGDNTIYLSLVSSLGHICVAFSRAFSFDNVADADVLGHRYCTEIDSIIVLHILHRELLQSFRNINNFLFIKYVIAATCEIFARA